METPTQNEPTQRMQPKMVDSFSSMKKRFVNKLPNCNISFVDSVFSDLLIIADIIDKQTHSDNISANNYLLRVDNNPLLTEELRKPISSFITKITSKECVDFVNCGKNNSTFASDVSKLCEGINEPNLKHVNNFIRLSNDIASKYKDELKLMFEVIKNGTLNGVCGSQLDIVKLKQLFSSISYIIGEEKTFDEIPNKYKYTAGSAVTILISSISLLLIIVFILIVTLLMK
jgi:hypothetical protein